MDTQPATVPSSDPIAIVAAIAIAPQKVTRTTGRSIGALGARAGNAPMLRPVVRVTFWGAMAMAATIAIGSLFGAVAA